MLSAPTLPSCVPVWMRLRHRQYVRNPHRRGITCSELVASACSVIGPSHACWFEVIKPYIANSKSHTLTVSHSPPRVIIEGYGPCYGRCPHRRPVRARSLSTERGIRGHKLRTRMGSFEVCKRVETQAHIHIHSHSHTRRFSQRTRHIAQTHPTLHVEDTTKDHAPCRLMKICPPRR